MLRTLRKYSCIIACMALWFITCGFGYREADEEEFPYGAGVFSWDHLPTDPDIRCMLENNITEIYQYIKPEYTDEEIEKFLLEMAEYEIDVYILDGEPEWSYKSNFGYMEAVLDRAIAYNEKSDRDKLVRGIVFDVEPYVLDKWHNIPDQLIEEYLSNITDIKKECEDKDAHIKIFTCIPYSYDLMGRHAALRDFIRNTDGVFVLNYSKGNEIFNLKREAALSRWYKKRLVTVYELQPGLLSQTNNSITYYKDGIDAVNLNYKEILNAYKNHDIGIAYHTLDYLRVLTMQNRNK